MPKMTETSRKMAQQAVKIRSTAEAIAYLTNNPPFRRLRDILLAADKEKLEEEALKQKIVNGICQNHPDKVRNSVQHTVGNWMNKNMRSLNRDVAFEVCLILGLSVEEADHFLMRVSDEAIHWRDPKEIVWAYAYEHHLTYEQTMELMAKAENLLDGKKMNAAQDVFTQTIRKEAQESLLGTQEALLEFIAQKQAIWGTFHNEAFALFTKYMNLLEMGTEDKDEYERAKSAQEEALKNNKAPQELVEEKMSVNRILDTYFFSRWVSEGKKGDSIHKSIKANWPSETVLSKMKNRKGNVDVSRKVLIMLFLATNGAKSAYQQNEDDLYEDEEPKTREQMFRDIYKRLNLMLTRCGFQTLDPRSPFDWIVMYSICVEDEVEMDQRLDEILEGLCSEADEEDAPEA